MGVSVESAASRFMAVVAIRNQCLEVTSSTTVLLHKHLGKSI